MSTNEDNDFGVEQTITELLTNNKELLDKQITKKNIENFIYQCKNQKKSERFINLLLALCSVDGEAVASK